MEDQPASTPAPQEDRGGSFGFFHYLGAFLLLLILYVLSIGPVAKIYYGPGPTPSLVDHFYSPLDFLYRRSSTCQSFFDWYFRKIWKIKIPTPPPPSTPANATPSTTATNSPPSAAGK